MVVMTIFTPPIWIFHRKKRLLWSLKELIDNFYDTIRDCVGEVLRDSLIPLEPLRDIMAGPYASISYLCGHKKATPYEWYVEAFMRRVGVWRNLHADPITHLIEVEMQRLRGEYRQQSEKILKCRELTLQSLKNICQVQR